MGPTGSKHWQNGDENDMQSDKCTAEWEWEWKSKKSLQEEGGGGALGYHSITHNSISVL